MNNLVTPLRDKINAAQEFCKQLPIVDVSQADRVELAQTNLRVEHHFSFGVYARTLYIPKGCMVIGQIHKFENLNILTKGRLRVVLNEETKDLEAPFTFVAPSNSKRAFYAVEDCEWVTILGTHEKDINIIEDYFIAHNEEEYLEYATKQLQLGL